MNKAIDRRRRPQARGRERANRIRTASRIRRARSFNDRSPCVSFLGSRALSLREHMKLVKQKREEADVNRLQRFQEQLRKKEEKWYARSSPARGDDSSETDCVPS